MSSNTDVIVIDTGSIVQFQPITMEAFDWIAEHVNVDPLMALPTGGFNADRRQAVDIFQGMAEFGLNVEAA